MAGQAESIGVPPSRLERRLRVFWLLLLAFNIVMLVVTLPPLVRGEKDAYFHQHARLVAGAVSGILLSATFLTRSTVKTAFFVAACASIGTSVWLAFR